MFGKEWLLNMLILCVALDRDGMSMYVKIVPYYTHTKEHSKAT